MLFGVVSGSPEVGQKVAQKVRFPPDRSIGAMGGENKMQPFSTCVKWNENIRLHSIGSVVCVGMGGRGQLSTQHPYKTKMIGVGLSEKKRNSSKSVIFKNHSNGGFFHGNFISNLCFGIL